jgi:hypothetical protein
MHGIRKTGNEMKQEPGQESASHKRILLRGFTVVACCAALGFAACKGATQTAPAAGATSAAKSQVQLQTYTATDQSAQAGVPQGWKVTDGSQTVIDMTGPNSGESIGLGRTFVARNAPFQAGQKGAGGADLSMPYSANLEQKFIMIWQQGAALSGRQAQQVTFNSATPIQMPAMLGQCGRFVASTTVEQGPIKMMGAFCSLPLDSGGTYKNILLLGQAPAALAAQDATIVQAVFSSYRVPQAMLAKKLAPFTAPPPRPIAGSAMGSVIPGMVGSDVSATCFDESVIRGYGPDELPRECGGRAPNP